MWSRVTGSVDEYPMIAVPSESPTRIESTPDSSTSRPNSASYAVIITSFSPLRFRSAKSRTVIARSVFGLSNARAPQRRQLTKPEVTIGELGMRDGETRLGHTLSLEQHDIEIESARPPALRAHTPGLCFDSLQLFEQLPRRQLRFDGDHLIEEWALRDRPEWSGLFGVGLTEDPGFVERRDAASCLRQKYLTSAEIGAERYVRDILHARSLSRATSA